MEYISDRGNSMKQLVVQMCMDESDLRKLQTLARLDSKNVGDQIRTLITKYLKKQEPEIQETKNVQNSEAESLRDLIAVVKVS